MCELIVIQKPYSDSTFSSDRLCAGITRRGCCLWILSEVADQAAASPLSQAGRSRMERS